MYRDTLFQRLEFEHESTEVDPTRIHFVYFNRSESHIKVTVRARGNAESVPTYQADFASHGRLDVLVNELFGRHGSPRLVTEETPLVAHGHATGPLL